jgi:hypothetical protein
VSETQWLDEVARAVLEWNADVEVSRPEPETLGVSIGLRTVVIHTSGSQAWLAPSFAAGGTIGSRLQDRVQHQDIQQYGVNEATIEVAVDAVIAHLRS